MKEEWPYIKYFTLSDSDLRKNVKKVLKKKWRERYYVKSITKKDDNDWIIELEKSFDLTPPAPNKEGE